MGGRVPSLAGAGILGSSIGRRTRDTLDGWRRTSVFDVCSDLRTYVLGGSLTALFEVSGSGKATRVRRTYRQVSPGEVNCPLGGRFDDFSFCVSATD